MALINPLTNSLELLKDFGFFQTVLPLLLIFAVFYGILQTTKIFGDPKDVQGINAALAFVAAFLVIAETEIVAAINKFLPQAAFLLVITVLILMLLSMFGFKKENMLGDRDRWTTIAIFVVIIIFLGILDASLSFDIPVIHSMVEAFQGSAGSGANGGSGGGLGIDEETINMLVGVLLLVGIPAFVMWLVVRKPKGS